MSNIYFVFDTLEQATAAKIKCMYGLKNNWAEPKYEKNSEKYMIEKPDEEDFCCANCSEEVKCEYVEKESEEDWFEADD